MRDEVLNTEELCMELLGFIVENYPGTIEKRYDVPENIQTHSMLYKIGENRGCIVRGNEISYEKAAALVLDDFRNGKLGRITLEKAQDMSE